MSDKTEFLVLVDELLERAVRRGPILCGSIPCAAAPGDPPCIISACARLVMSLKGRDRHAISIEGRRLDVDLGPGGCIYFAAQSWSIPYYQSRAEIFSIVFLPWCVRFVRALIAPAQGPRRVISTYHTATPASPATVHVTRALDNLAEEANRGQATRELLVVLLRLVRKQLADDVPISQTHYGALGTWESILHHLEEHFKHGVTRASIAEMFDLHPSYLSALARQLSGQSFREVLEGIRMRHARRMLRETKLKLARVATLCGYRDAIHFSKAFHRAAGITPGRFRQQK